MHSIIHMTLFQNEEIRSSEPTQIKLTVCIQTVLTFIPRVEHTSSQIALS
jgi:hypothetical protein